MGTDTRIDSLYKALANPTRREILKRLIEAPGTPIGQLAKHFEQSRISILGHVKVLESAGLVANGCPGSRHELYFSPAALHMLHTHCAEEFSLEQNQPDPEPFQDGYSI